MKRLKYSRGLTALWVALILGLASESMAEQYELFAGILRDSRGNPLVGTVSVISSGSTEVATTRSLADGSFELYALYAESYIINASAPGHLPYSETNVALPREDLMLQLVPTETFTIDPTQPARVTDSRGTLLELPAGALVDKLGRSPSGDITVSMYTYGSDTEAMPENRTGVKLDGQRTALRSLGAVSVEFTDGEGQYYNLATGRRARLSVRLPDGVVESEPVPLWSYNPQDGLWYQGEGSGTQSGSVIVGEVEHFSAWTFAVSFPNPACIHITVDRNWVESMGGTVNMLATALTFKAASQPMLIGTSTLSHVFYDLEPNSLVLFEFKDKTTSKYTPYAIINAGAPWGGKPGERPTPSQYNRCNGRLVVDGNAQVGAVAGRVLLQHRGIQAGVDIEIRVNGITLRSTTNGNGEFNVIAPPGRATVIARKAGYLPVELQNADVTAGPATSLGDATLLAGDVDDKDGKQCVDTADMRAINGAIASSITSANEVLDINADLKIDFTDLRLAAGNGRKCGPTPWVKAKH